MFDDTKQPKSDAPQDDVVLETDTESENFKDPAEQMKKLKEQLKVCQEERREYLDGWQRAKADFINARRDEERIRAEVVKFSNEGLIRELLPALDSFHVAFGNKEAWEKADLGWRMGVQHIYTQLRSVLEKNGMTLIEPKAGEPFDPKKHHSVGVIPVAEKEKDHTVVEAVSKGYALHGKIVEPAKVKIGEYADPRTNADFTRTSAEKR